MTRRTIRTASLLLLLIAAAGCSDYSAPSSTYDPPSDTTFADGLWTSSGSLPAIFRLSSSQLQSSGSVSPATSITTSSASLFTLNSVAFDAAGTLWMTSQHDSLLLAFRRSALVTSGVRIASRVIASDDSSLSAPSALAFDAAHGLWVANSGNGTIVRFDSAQLASAGRPTPVVILSQLGHPTGLAFDASGSLWFSDNHANRLAKFSAAQLSHSGTILPEVVINNFAGSFSSPSGLAFDGAGNLWVANTGRSTVIALGSDQLNASGRPIPRIVISPTDSTASLPVGLAFDDHGSLWVVYGEGLIAKYDHAALAASGAPAPAVRLVINDHILFWSPAFWPKPAGLPLR
jgi:sugar lactone lactonase YvrE